jgi:AcrR family transcriptional regulator
MATTWAREDQPDLAADRIMDAAEVAFSAEGVSRTSMATVAQYAGCSRGTLYRYFPNIHALHLAYINRSALRIVHTMSAEIAAIPDPQQRFLEGILISLREVRRHPGMLAWFEPETAGLAARLSRSSEVIDALTSTFVAELLRPLSMAGNADEECERHETSLWARWLVRVIISFLSMPGEDETDERAQIERFAAPVIREIVAGGAG